MQSALKSVVVERDVMVSEQDKEESQKAIARLAAVLAQEGLPLKAISFCFQKMHYKLIVVADADASDVGMRVVVHKEKRERGCLSAWVEELCEAYKRVGGLYRWLANLGWLTSWNGHDFGGPVKVKVLGGAVNALSVEVRVVHDTGHRLLERFNIDIKTELVRYPNIPFFGKMLKLGLLPEEGCTLANSLLCVESRMIMLQKEQERFLLC